MRKQEGRPLRPVQKSAPVRTHRCAFLLRKGDEYGKRARLTLFKTVILCYDEGVYKMNTFHLIYCLSRGRKTAYNAVKKGEVHAADGDRAVFDTGLCGVYLFFR